MHLKAGEGPWGDRPEGRPLRPRPTPHRRPCHSAPRQHWRGHTVLPAAGTSGSPRRVTRATCCSSLAPHLRRPDTPSLQEALPGEMPGHHRHTGSKQSPGRARVKDLCLQQVIQRIVPDHPVHSSPGKGRERKTAQQAFSRMLYTPFQEFLDSSGSYLGGGLEMPLSSPHLYPWTVAASGEAGSKVTRTGGLGGLVFTGQYLGEEEGGREDHMEESHCDRAGLPGADGEKHDSQTPKAPGQRRSGRPRDPRGNERPSPSPAPPRQVQPQLPGPSAPRARLLVTFPLGLRVDAPLWFVLFIFYKFIFYWCSTCQHTE